MCLLLEPEYLKYIHEHFYLSLREDITAFNLYIRCIGYFFVIFIPLAYKTFFQIVREIM